MSAPSQSSTSQGQPLLDGPVRKGPALPDPSSALAALTAVSDAVLITDLDGRVTFANDAFSSLNSFGPSGVLGRNIFDTAGITVPLFDAAHGAVVPIGLGWENLPPSPATPSLQWQARPILDDAGLRTGWLFLGRPLAATIRPPLGIALEQLAAFPQWNPNPVLEFGGDGDLTYINDATRELACALGDGRVESILPPGTREIVVEALETGLPRIRHEQEYGDRVISWSFFPILALGVVHCYAGDVTERRSLEQQFRQVQKLESLGRLAGGVAHDFNNLLTVIKGQASCVSSGQLPANTEAEALQQILMAAERGSNLTRQLLAFSRQQAVQFRSIDLNAAIQAMERLLSRVVGEHVEFVLEPSETVSPVRADVSMIEQILLNLAVNARDAMPDGGVVRIRTEDVTVGPEYSACDPDSQAGRFVRLSFEDTGCGISPEHLPRIFEPFFTTKDAGKGTGLGLATVYGIVKQHHGWIRVFSDKDRGTTFQIHLPVASGPVGPTTHLPAKGKEPTAQGQGTILVVEDEDPVRRLIASALRTKGYEVHEANTGSEALARFNELGEKVDLLLADVVMPGGISGRELAVTLTRRRPGLCVLLISGYSDETGDPLDAFRCLPKPFDLDELHASLSEIFARTSRPEIGK